MPKAVAEARVAHLQDTVENLAAELAATWRR
jgi:hypothetical protein